MVGGPACAGFIAARPGASMEFPRKRPICIVFPKTRANRPLCPQPAGLSASPRTAKLSVQAMIEKSAVHCRDALPRLGNASTLAGEGMIW